MKRRSVRAPFLLLWVAVTVGFDLGGRLEAQEAMLYEFSQPAMGTLFRIQCYADSGEQAQRGAQAAFRRVQELNEVCSDYLPKSELMRLCRAGSLMASQDLFEVIQRSQDVATMSGGAFDITVGHYTNLWRRAKRKGVLPTGEQLAQAKALTGWQKVRLEAGARRITLQHLGMQLDLGGAAKGYAADKALEVLRKHGLTQAVVAASGDLAIGDAPPAAPDGWEVKLRTFEAPEAQDKLVTLRLKNCGVSTSGDLHQAVEIGGQRYSHIVDSATGLGLTERRACSVIARDCTSSDIWATTLCVLGVERGMALASSQPEMQVRIVELGHAAVMTVGWPRP